MKIFNYIEELDCFIVNPEYMLVADKLGLSEWNEVVWIGRYFTLDNDYGEHWFDNWTQRELLESKAKLLGFDSNELLILDPNRFKNGYDGPCHNDEQINRFWTDVLKSLDLSLETIFEEAIKFNNEREKDDEEYILYLDDIINEIKMNYNL